jgi:exopolysaccharide biosynthesis polyprenyl glycosylphosphotransferase
MPGMKTRDNLEVAHSCMAVAGDALAIAGGFLLATWLRFDSGLMEVPKGIPPNHHFTYGWGAIFATVIFLAIFRSVGLYKRPQVGSFPNVIPKLVRAISIGFVLTTALAFALRTEPPLSRMVILISIFNVFLGVMIVRFILFRVELHMARHSTSRVRILILGTNSVASHLKRALISEPRLRSQVIGYVSTSPELPDENINQHDIMGSVKDFVSLCTEHQVDKVIVADATLPHDQMESILLHCERNLITFNMVPDLFHIMTSSIDMQAVDDIPLISVGAWPLDNFWNRAIKRIEDIIGAVVGLIISSVILLISAIIIRLTSPGPVFYRQVRCGENGKTFTLYKLRTMVVDAEEKTGPVWAKEDDDRRTGFGSFLRAYNLDELPQFWNVLIGDMSLVGPRPERPHFVEQFKEEIERYMSRHVSKPGMTGWAQVNGLRGNTSLTERIRYDLYYLENWSLAFDFKILVRTFFTRENAY